MPPTEGHSPVSADTVRHVASLCQLDLSDKQVEVERVRLGAIIGYMDRLRGVVGDAPAEADLVTRGELRGDEPGPTLSPEAVAELAPEAWNGYIRVPKVLSEGSSS